MLKRLGSIWRNTREMPLVMRVLCQGAMVAIPLLILALVLPVTDWEVDGRVMTYRDLWTSGNGAAITVCLSLYCFGAWGLAARRHSSRWVLVAACLAPAVLVAVGDRAIPWVSFFEAAICSAAMYFCLFRLPSVRLFMDGSGKSLGAIGCRQG